MVCGCLKFSQWKPQPVGVCSLARGLVFDFVGRTYYVNPLYHSGAPPTGMVAEDSVVSNWPSQGTQIGDPLEFDSAGVRCLMTSLVPPHGSFPLLSNTDILDPSWGALVWTTFIEGGTLIIEFTPTGVDDWSPIAQPTLAGHGNMTLTWLAAGPTVTVNLYDSTATLRATVSQPASAAGKATRVMAVINPVDATGPPTPGQLALSVNGQAPSVVSAPEVNPEAADSPYLYGALETDGVPPLELGAVGLIAQYNGTLLPTNTPYSPFNPNFLAQLARLSKVGATLPATINWAQALNPSTNTMLC